MPDAPPSPVALAAAIRQIRERESLTQEALAARAGLHLTFISQVESGRKDMRWTTVQRLAGGLGVSVLELVALAERLKLD